MSEKETDFLDELEVPATNEAETPAEAAPAKDEADKGAPAKVETAEATPAAAVEKEDRVPLAALMAERDKRQKEQSQREQLQRELELLKAERQRAEAPTFFDSPENYVAQAVQTVQAQAERRLFDVLDAEARDAFPDYDEVMQELTGRVEQNPQLRQEIFSAPNPAKAAYRLGKKLREMEAMQDPETYRQRLEAEIRTKLEAESKAKEEARRAAAAQIPPDLASARNATAETAVQTGSVFDDIFKGS